MNPLYKLQQAGQSIWLDSITRGLLDDGTLKHYIDDLAVTGLTSNPTIFNKAIEGSNLYDDAIHQKSREGKSGGSLFFELALEDLRRAADLFRPTHDATQGIDGWVSLEVSPLLAADTAATIDSAVQLHASAARPNDPAASDTLYVLAWAAANTINTIPAATLLAFADHGQVQNTLPPEGGNYEATLTSFKKAGINETDLSEQLQTEGTASFAKSWDGLLAGIAKKSATLKKTRSTQGGAGQ